MADQVLTLATAGLPAGFAPGNQFPRVDYITLQNVFKTEVVNYDIYNHTHLGRCLRHLETQLHSDVYLAFVAFRRRRNYRLTFAMSERVGIPLAWAARALWARSPLVAMFQCWSPLQELTITRLKLFAGIKKIIVHCRSMKSRFAALGVPPEKVKVIRYGIDQCYFRPMPEVPAEPNFVMAAGEVRSRDYRSLFEAVRRLPVKLTVAASGHWYAREKNIALETAAPANVKVVRHLSYDEMKHLYARSQFVVLPVHDVVYSAGATASLEAMCMARAVVAFRSSGIQDYVIHGETGILVDPGDVQALREAIVYLLAHPKEARRLGENGRTWVDQEMNMDRYVQEMAELLRQAA